MKNHDLLLVNVLVLVILFASSCKKDLTLPDVALNQNYSVISPNRDGIQDKMTIKVKLTTKNYIRYWEMRIVDDDLQPLYVKKSLGDLENLKKKYFLKKENVFIPEQIVWDGKNSSNKVVPDGKYYIQFIVMDNNKNIIDTKTMGLRVIYVDTVKPSAECLVENTIFSPNGDGNKDSAMFSLTIAHDALEEKYPELQEKQWHFDIEKLCIQGN
jgi:hypothetical protein